MMSMCLSASGNRLICSRISGAHCTTSIPYGIDDTLTYVIIAVQISAWYIVSGGGGLMFLRWFFVGGGGGGGVTT